MSRATVQIYENVAEFDGVTWRAISGRTVESLTRILNGETPVWRNSQNYFPYWTQGVAILAAKAFKGTVIDYQPDPPDPTETPNRIY